MYTYQKKSHANKSITVVLFRYFFVVVFCSLVGDALVTLGVSICVLRAASCHYPQTGTRNQINSNACMLFLCDDCLNLEVRQEAVQQALAALKNRPKPSLPMPSKRSSVLNRSPDRIRDDTGKNKSQLCRFFVCLFF